MSRMQEDIQYAGSDTRPPMLDRTDFESWQQRIRLYCLGKDNGENIMKSIKEGPFQMGTVSDVITGGTEGAVQQGPVRARVLNDLSAEEKERYKADIRATNILLQVDEDARFVKRCGYFFLKESSRSQVKAVKEAIWLRRLLKELGVELNTMAVNCDNQGAIHLSRNHVFHEMTKHINVRYHFIREVLEAKTIKVLNVGTKHNAADALTKVVPGLKLQHCLELLNVGVG
ncbi:hypothetical protein Tco_1156365 [Tanacetum coccineum]